jgi:hypothetical protein
MNAGKKTIETLMDGRLVVVKPEDMSETVPLFCKICAYPMKTLEDSIAYRKVGTCSKCDGRWSNDKRVNWKEGKHPDPEWEEWAEYIKDRGISARSPIIFR